MSGEKPTSGGTGRPERRRPRPEFRQRPPLEESARHIVERSARISTLQPQQLGGHRRVRPGRSLARRRCRLHDRVGDRTVRCRHLDPRQWVRSAANLESLPCLAEGVASGELSLDLVEPLAEVAAARTDRGVAGGLGPLERATGGRLVAWHRAQSEEADEARAAEAVAAGVDIVDPRCGSSSIARSASTTPGGRSGLRRTTTQRRSRPWSGGSRPTSEIGHDTRVRGPSRPTPYIRHGVGRRNLRTSFWQAC